MFEVISYGFTAGAELFLLAVSFIIGLLYWPLIAVFICIGLYVAIQAAHAMVSFYLFKKSGYRSFSECLLDHIF